MRLLEGQGTDAFFDASSYGSDDVYTAWVASVKSMGGTPTVLPDTSIAIDPASSHSVYMSMLAGQSIPAAKLSAKRVDELGMDANYADAVSPDGKWLYFVAPQNVIDWVANHGIQDTGIVLSKSAIEKSGWDLTPDWAKNLSTAGKVVTVVAIGGAVVYALSWLPRPRWARSA